jgi:hypothetical protein
MMRSVLAALSFSTLVAAGLFPFRMPLPPINGTAIFSVQLICLVAGTTFGPNCTADFTASPALFFGI